MNPRRRLRSHFSWKSENSITNESRAIDWFDAKQGEAGGSCNTLLK